MGRQPCDDRGRDWSHGLPRTVGSHRELRRLMEHSLRASDLADTWVWDLGTMEEHISVVLSLQVYGHWYNRTWESHRDSKPKSPE